MNNGQRKTLDKVIKKLEAINATLPEFMQKVIDGLNEAKGTVEEVRDEEQDKFDNMPDSLQESSRGGRLEETVQHLDTVIEQLDEMIDSLESESMLDDIVANIESARDA